MKPSFFYDKCKEEDHRNPNRDGISAQSSNENTQQGYVS